MDPGEPSSIPEYKDILVAAEGVAAEGHHVSQNAVDVMVAAHLPDSVEIPSLSAWKKPEIDGKVADNVDVLLSLDKQLFYNDLTFEQVRECKLHSDDRMRGVISSSGTFYACLACTLQFHTGTTEGEGHPSSLQRQSRVYEDGGGIPPLSE